MPQPVQPIPVLSSIAPLAGSYDAWLCDIWGVMHDGITPFEEAAAACTRFRSQGGAVVMISNSPRPGQAVARQMAELGVPEGTCDAIVTSGDTTRQVIADRSATPLFHLGPERDKPLLDGLDVTVAELPNAGYVLCTGLYDDSTETPDDYGELLSEMLARNLPMVCANPDIQVERGNRLIYCAGALAQAYADLGGEVVYTGKPHAPIYDRAMALIVDALGREVERDRILCIGDGIKTDMAGGAAAGMAALYVASRLHIESSEHGGGLTPDQLELAFAGETVRPVAAMDGLRW